MIILSISGYECCEATVMSSYDELLKQVRSLKLENTQLHRELQGNSSHLTKLENEASNFKDVLDHVQMSSGMQDDVDYSFAEESMCREHMAEGLAPNFGEQEEMFRLNGPRHKKPCLPGSRTTTTQNSLRIRAI